MPTIHVSENVWQEIQERKKSNESPTDTIERIFRNDRDDIEDLIEQKIKDMVLYEALEDRV